MGSYSEPYKGDHAKWVLNSYVYGKTEGQDAFQKKIY